MGQPKTKSKEDEFYEKYVKVHGEVGIYDTEEEALDHNNDWVVLDGQLFSKKWEAYENDKKKKENKS